jgi:hypothetical protein
MALTQLLNNNPWGFAVGDSVVDHQGIEWTLPQLMLSRLVIAL